MRGGPSCLHIISAGLHLNHHSSLPWSKAFVVASKEKIGQCPQRQCGAWLPTNPRQLFCCCILMGRSMPLRHHIAVDTHRSRFCLELAREQTLVNPVPTKTWSSRHEGVSSWQQRESELWMLPLPLELDQALHHCPYWLSWCPTCSSKAVVRSQWQSNWLHYPRWCRWVEWYWLLVCLTWDCQWQWACWPLLVVSKCMEHQLLQPNVPLLIAAAPV